MSYEIPQNGFDFTETGKFLNPYRDYAFYFIKFVKDFLTLDRLQKLNWNNMSEKEKKLYAPVIMWGTPKRAYAPIVTPLLNGNLASFGFAARYSDFSPITDYNATKFLLEEVKLERINPQNEKKEYMKVKLTRPFAFDATVNINLFALSERDADELLFRWQWQFNNNDYCVIKVYNIDNVIIWNDKWENTTSLEPGLEDKGVMRFTSSCTIKFCFFPSGIYSSQIYKAIEYIYVNLEIDNDINESIII